VTTPSVACAVCGEQDNLEGRPAADGIELICHACGHSWMRDKEPTCATCGSEDLQTVPLAIVERSRGTQLSILGTRPITLCTACDADVLRHYHDHRPSPLMPTDLPTVGEEQMKR
jgi:hypothetical protein